MGGTGSPQAVLDAVGSAMADDHSSNTPLVTADLSGRFEGMESTPQGMSLPEGSGSTVNVEAVELPPTTTKVSKQDSSSTEQVVSEPPALAATDPEMDTYRAYALQQYQLA